MRAQDATVPDDKVPVYDAVVIKPDKSGSGNSATNTSLSLYKATNVSLKSLLEDAYRIKEDLITGVPRDVESARFDIEAKVVDPDMDVLKHLKEDQRRSMRREILLDRFHVKAHIEVKTLPVYEMTLTKDGPKFKEAAKSEGGSGTSSNISGSEAEFTANDITMAELAGSLYFVVKRTVLDRTGLTEKYDFKLKWLPDDAPETGNDSGPSLFTALKEQLGIRLESAKGPVDTLVIDHAEMPSEN